MISLASRCLTPYPLTTFTAESGRRSSALVRRVRAQLESTASQRRCLSREGVLASSSRRLGGGAVSNSLAPLSSRTKRYLHSIASAPCREAPTSVLRQSILLRFGNDEKSDERRPKATESRINYEVPRSLSCVDWRSSVRRLSAWYRRRPGDGKLAISVQREKAIRAHEHFRCLRANPALQRVYRARCYLKRTLQKLLSSPPPVRCCARPIVSCWQVSHLLRFFPSSSA